MTDLPNFKDFCEGACLKLWGKPDSANARELRWKGADQYSAKSFDRQKRVWYDQGQQRGGSTLELVAYHKGQPKRDLKGAAFFDEWRAAHAMGLVPDPPPDKPNGNGNGAWGAILATYPYHDENGVLLFEVVRFDTADRDRRFRQRRPDGNGGWIWDVKGVRTHVLYRLPALINAVKAGQRVLIAEGERDADTAVALGYPATTMPGGVGKWRAEYDEVFRDHNADIIIVSDNDEQAKDPKTRAPQVHPNGKPVLPGQDHAATVLKHIRKVAAHARLIIFPDHKDLSAWVAAGGDRAALDGIIEAAHDLIKEPPPKRPTPTLGTPEFEIDSAWPDRAVTSLRDILSKRAELFERGVPVRVAFDQVAGGSVAHELSPESLILEAHFVSRPFAMVPNEDGEGEHPEPVQLPLIMSKMYLHWRGEWRLKPLNGITTAPILSEDGSIRAARGYDPATGLWCENIPDIARLVPPKPTKADAEKALSVIRAFFRTFCFADAETVSGNGGINLVDLRKQPGQDESGFLSSLLGSVCRASLWLAPGYLYHGAQLSGSGVGKGRLARCVCNVAYGRQPRAVAPGGNHEELEKRIAAALLEGGPAVLLDNFNNMTLRSNSLESALSERPACVRQFRTLENVQLNAVASTFLTGNATTPGRDLVRRLIETAFDARMEDPEQRPFSGDIVAEALRQRADLLVAALTIWRYGRQASLKQGKALGSYEQWCAWVRDPLLALGCRDPIERLSEAKQSDPFRELATALLAVWWERHGSSPQTAHGLDPEVKRIIDPHEKGRQFIAGQLERFAGTRIAGFHLTRHKGLNPREAATYKLEQTTNISQT